MGLARRGKSLRGRSLNKANLTGIGKLLKHSEYFFYRLNSQQRVKEDVEVGILRIV